MRRPLNTENSTMHTHSSDRWNRKLLRRGAAAITTGVSVLLLATSPALAVKPGQFKLVGASLETSSDLVSLPAPGGTLVLARDCEACESKELRLAPDTQFRVNGKAVGFADFRKAATASAQPLYVYYRRADFTLLKLDLEIYD